MKRSLSLAFAMFNILCFVDPQSAGAISAAPSEPFRIDLGGAWEFAPVDEDWSLLDESPPAFMPGEWRRADAPGCVHTDLLREGLIPDPFVGRNEIPVQGVEKTGWRYRRTFRLDTATLTRRRLDLVCEGLDTLADIHVNGRRVGRADNMFRRWVFPVGEALREGDNVIEIVFDSPVETLATLKTRRYEGPVPAINDPVGDSPYFRKAPYQFGWDWAPRLVTCGVWRPIYLIASDQPLIESLITQQRHEVDGKTGARTVELDIRVEVDSPVATRASLAASLDDDEIVRGEIAIPEGRSWQTLTARVENPSLWRPNGRGARALYDLAVELTPPDGETVARRTRVGFRTIRLETPTDDDGVGFRFVVNGEPIFCKGANWIPADSFPSRVSPARLRHLLESAAACNMNMIRVWGGGCYESNEFYDLCDELGLLVWQDFMYSCSAYPADQGFLDNARAEAEDNIARLANHPSVALWCGNNECETAVRQWYKLESRRWRAYERLFHELLPEACARLDPARDYWPSSPHSIAAAKPNDHSDGDCHIWDVWHRSKPFEAYEDMSPRFCSEFGYQSFPCVETIRAYAGDDLNLTAPAIGRHQKNRGGNTRILSQMTDRFRMPNGFENFVVVSQLQQALAMRTAVDHWRRLAPRCMGTLYWQLNDCWPVASWSSIDYFGRWKALQYFARRFYEPVHVTSAFGKKDDAPLGLYVTSDIARDTTFTLEWTLQTYDGVVIDRGAEEFRIEEGATTRVATVGVRDYLVDWMHASDATPFTPANSYLTFAASDGEFVTRGVRHFAPFKDLDLPRPNLRLQTRRSPEGIVLTISTDRFAKWVWIEAEGAPDVGQYSDNYFDLDPGESREVRYGGPLPEGFRARSLVDTYAD